MRTVLAVLALGLLLVGCGQGPAVDTKSDANSSGTVTQAKTLRQRLSALTEEEAKKLVADAGGVLDLKEPTEAEIAETKAKAEAGDADAQKTLGDMYRRGQGVEQDLREAVKWFRKAAEQGDARAQFTLGWLYNGGLSLTFEQTGEMSKLLGGGVSFDDAFTTVAKGISRDDKEAAKWYRKAAEQGYALAQNNLGAMYYNGNGVPEDYVTAYAWYNIAAANGHPAGGSFGWEKNKLKLAKNMTLEQIAEAQKLSREMIKKNPKLLNK